MAAPTLMFNVFTGTFDYVGSTGGGGGSGTLQNIDENGSVVVANATVLNFVEPAATIVTDAGGGQADVALSAYLLLAGRTGTTNDALISTTTDGSITGASTVNKGIVLNANTDATLQTNQSIFFNKNVTTIGPITTAAPHVFEMAQSLTWDTTSNPCALVYFEFATQDTTVWDIIGPNGLLGIFGMLIQPNVQGEIGSGQMLMGFSSLLDFEPIITSRGPGGTAGDFGGLFLGKTDMAFIALNVGDTLTVPEVGNTTHQIRVGGDGTTTVATNFGWTHKGARGSGGSGTPTVDKDAGLWFPPRLLTNDPIVATTVMATVFNEDPVRALQHAGPGIFGSSATPEAESVLELVSTPGTPRALLLPRMTGTDEAAFASPQEGMAIANTTSHNLRFYNGTSWVSATGATGATGPAGAPGMDGLDGEDGWWPGMSGPTIPLPGATYSILTPITGGTLAWVPLGSNSTSLTWDKHDTDINIQLTSYLDSLGAYLTIHPNVVGFPRIDAHGPSWTIVDMPAGPPGLDGDPGEDGLSIPGPRGARGVEGPMGLPGFDGDDGMDWPPIPGPPGPSSVGATGPQGSQGIPGNDGDDGPDGWPILGPAGVQGATGATGPAGPIGLGMDGVDGDDLGLLSHIWRHNDLTDLTVGDPHTQYAFLAGRSGGQTLQGDTAGSGALTLESTANATKGPINVKDQLLCWTSGATLTGGKRLLAFSTAFTINSALATVDLVGCNTTITDSAIAILTAFNLNPTISRNSSGAAFTSFTGMSSQPTLNSDALVITSGAVAGFNHNPTYAVTNSGTIAGINDTGLNLALVAGASTTVATRTGVAFGNATGAGAVTNQIAVDVAALAKGGTLNCAFRSAIAASTGKNYFLRDTGGADSVVKGQVRIGDTTDPTALVDIVGKTTINTSGLVTKYNNVATAGLGVPSIIAVVDLTTQAAAATAAALVTPPAAGMYRVSFAITLTRAGTTSTVGAGVNLNYTSGDGAVAQVQNVPMWLVGSTTAPTDSGSTANTVGLCLTGAVTVYSSTTAMTYDIGYTSSGGTSMQYAVRIRVEAL